MTDFDHIAEAYRASQGGPIADQKQQRKLYALYKQATAGDAKGRQPGFFNFEDQSKFQAWKKLTGMPRDEARHRFVQLAHRLGYRDPGDSPVDWISDQTWRREESWVNPELQQRFPCVTAPQLTRVSDDHRQLAPTLASPDDEPLAPEGDDREHLQQLEDPPDTRAFQIQAPQWPVCCRRLTVLVGYRGVDREFEDVVDRVYRVDEQESEGWKDLLTTEEPSPYGEKTLRDGLLLFYCRNCGGVYLSSHQV